MTQQLYDLDLITQDLDRLQERFQEAASVIDQLAAIERRFRDLEQTRASWRAQVDSWQPVREQAHTLVSGLQADAEAMDLRMRAFDAATAERLTALTEQADALRIEQRAELGAALEHHQQRITDLEQILDARWAELRAEQAAVRAALDAAMEQHRIELAAAHDQRWAELRAELQRAQEQVFAAHANLRAEVELRLTDIRGELEQRIAVLRRETDTRVATIEARLQEQARIANAQIESLTAEVQEERRARAAQTAEVEDRLAQQIAGLAARATALENALPDIDRRLSLLRFIASAAIGLGAPALLLGMLAVFLR